MRYKGYVGAIKPDADTRVLHGEIADIRDIVTFQGRDAQEARREFRKSVDDYLAFCRERGESPNTPCSPPS
jgi:predicted HicB family RNase H-like nuclease